ncbi:Glycosyltransferase involved in cell wall bisynthesis [Rhizobiales bacterium GAS191]|nr:Glycosyltransferase involved in cell wall bisynthesis [Rhizobiales bacterium GAS191]
MKKRVAVVNSHPIQYFAPLYAYLNASSDISVTALYLSDCSIRGTKDPGFGQVVTWDVDLLSGYEARFMKGAATAFPAGFFSLIAPDLWGAIRNGDFDAVLLHGHHYAANFIAMAAAKSAGIPVLMRCDTHLKLKRKGMKQILRKPILSAVYRACDGFLAIGDANKEFYVAMGVPADKISIVPCAVDNARFMASSSFQDSERRALRHSLGISNERPAILYASKLQRRKHPDCVVRAAQRLASEGVAFDLVIVGAGEMEGELRKLVAEGGPANTVFTGFVNQDRLPKILGACDVFVLPSEEEPWGLIVNEAMCAGLPIVVGADVGCVPNLVRDGENGLLVQPADTMGLAAALRRIVTDPQLALNMSTRSRQIIGAWGFEQCLDGWRQSLARYARPRKAAPAAPGRRSQAS